MHYFQGDIFFFLAEYYIFLIATNTFYLSEIGETVLV